MDGSHLLNPVEASPKRPSLLQQCKCIVRLFLISLTGNFIVCHCLYLYPIIRPHFLFLCLAFSARICFRFITIKIDGVTCTTFRVVTSGSENCERTCLLAWKRGQCINFYRSLWPGGQFSPNRRSVHDSYMVAFVELDVCTSFELLRGDLWCVLPAWQQKFQVFRPCILDALVALNRLQEVLMCLI
jgi:hypothetical protein